MESAELARWQRFAAKGGIGRSNAVVDCVAERDGDLMFLKDDEVTVLMQLPESGYYLGFCEGVVGRFAIADVQVHGKLKRAVMARRPASGLSSPTASPIALPVAPSPSIPHTTYSPVRPHPIDQLMANARAENSLTGISTLLASPPVSESVLPNHEPETEPEPPKSISPLPPSSPLRINTTTATATLQRESLTSLASTAASPLSDTSAFSFRQRRSEVDGDDQDTGVQSHREETSELDQAADEDGEQDEDDNSRRNNGLPSPRSPDTGNSRASTPSVGDPFQHDDPTRAPRAPPPLILSDDSVRPGAEEDEATPYGDRGESIYSVNPAPLNTERTRIASAALSDGEVGIGLTLIGGLLGAGRESMSEYEGGEEGSESDYGHEDEYGIRTGAGELEYGEDDSSLYRDDSFGAPDDEERKLDDAGSVALLEGGDETSLANGVTTPVANGGGRASQGSTESRSSTPPFGFELEPTVHRGVVEGKECAKASSVSDVDLAPTEEASSTPIDSTSTTPVERTRPTPIGDDRSTPVDERRSAPIPITQGGDTSSDDESDYGQEVQPNPTSPGISIPDPDSAPSDTEDFETALPPFRPPYHRASGSMRSITSSDAGGYYDDGIYDHYRYSHVSMAARSMRMSMIGGGEMPPLPGENERGEGRRFAPLNIQPKPPSIASGSGSGLESQASPRSQAPMSPTSQGPQSPLAHGEPASPRSMGSGLSPLAAGPILQAQMQNKEAGPLLEPQLSVNTGLAPITTSGLTPASPGALAVPLSPTPSGGPPSPALSANLASSLRQAIEQQRAESAGPTPDSVPESEDNAQDVDENKPVLGSPLMIQGSNTASPIASLQRRPSQFAPHPNAPKPAHLFTPATTPFSNPSGPSDPNVGQQTGDPHLGLHDALQMVVQRLRTGGVRTPTIHGRTHSELALSLGPVPISFVFDPDGRSALSAGAGGPSRAIGGAQRSASMNIGSGPGSGVGGGEYVGSKLRPRSRSFSAAPQEEMNTLRSAGEPSVSAIQSETKASSGAIPAASSPLAQPPTPRLPQTPTAPILTSITPNLTTPASESPTQSSPNSSPIKRVASPPTNTASSSTSKSPFRGLRNVASSTMMRVGFGSGSVPPSPVIKRRSSDNLQQPQRVESPAPRRKQSDDISRPVDMLDIHTPTSASMSTSPMASSSMSLHSKVSSTGLKMPRTNATADTPTTPLSPVGSVQLAEETVHFHDMDFDMVKPKRSRVSVVRTSEDGAHSISRSSHQSDRPLGPAEDEGQASSPTSPTAASPSHQIRGSIPVSLAPGSSAHNSLTTPADIAAHISREQRWITTMQTVPSASVRKNKKIKKLLLEGVPASVRGVVWLYLTDSKARRMVGLYSQLVKRGKVPATPEILKDAESCFTTQPHLRAVDGPVVSILQAYLAMVPDITYSQGLCQLAGNLLMHSPEEDAFWTFVALMDSYLRGYCAINSVQMEVDSVFFAKTLESNDPQLAAKLFRDLRLGAVDFCKPWVLSGFIGVVPYEYSCRIWDVFLFEGAPFLFRIALALLSCLKKQIMTLTPKSSPGVLAFLLSISPTLLPADPDQLIASAYSVKFKDDDMRKMRPKIEAQLRKESGFNRPVPIRDALKK